MSWNKVAEGNVGRTDSLVVHLREPSSSDVADGIEVERADRRGGQDTILKSFLHTRRRMFSRGQKRVPALGRTETYRESSCRTHYLLARR